MAVELFDPDLAYKCLSSDSKPANPSYSLLYEVDTQVWYVWDGNSWEIYNGAQPDTATQISLAAQGLITQSFDRQNVQNSQIMVGGTTYFIAVPLFAGQVATNACFVINVAGADVTLGKLGLYDMAGNRLAVTASQTTAWQSAGDKEVPFTAPYTVPATGMYYIALLCTATTTLPTVFRGVGTAGQITTASFGASGIVPLGTEASQTDLDATATIGATSTIGFWVGLS